jgi:hypothetical protein
MTLAYNHDLETPSLQHAGEFAIPGIDRELAFCVIPVKGNR